MNSWQEKTTASTKEATASTKEATASTKGELNYRALADRLKRGEIVLFLGSDIPSLSHSQAPMKTLVPELKKKAEYQGNTDSLSMIAEYYQMTDYGRSSLVGELKTVIKSAGSDIPLYRLLARIEQPLVLISANYDLFLEHQLQKAGRKYALIASIIISNPPDYELGNVIVHYSDREAPEFLHLEEELSSLKLIEDSYALIYKIRGYCNTVHRQMPYQDNILTLAEQNYFTFARHMDRLIPNYLVKQFAMRGLFFLGYSPSHWEDRLLVDGILDKRRHQRYETARVITKDTDPFVRAYWDSRGVLRLGLELAEFVRGLEEYL